MTEQQLQVKHVCGHRAVYLLLMDENLQAEIAAEIEAKPCLLCQKRQRAYGRWGWLRKRSAGGQSEA